jgi:hypothetical protein
MTEFLLSEQHWVCPLFSLIQYPFELTSRAGLNLMYVYCIIFCGAIGG